MNTKPLKSRKSPSLSRLLGQDIGDLLYVLAGGGEQRLLLHFLPPSETAVAKPVELFGIRKASLDRLVAQSVQISPGSASATGLHPFLAVLPHMPRDHFRLVLRPRAFLQHGAVGTMSRIGPVLAISVAVRRAVFQLMLLRTNIHVLVCIILEPPFGDSSLGRCICS